jgi:hypothetical protein
VLPADVLDTARQAFVDGLGLAATVAGVVVIIAAALVYKFLPSDKNSAEVTGEAGEVDAAALEAEVAPVAG